MTGWLVVDWHWRRVGGLQKDCQTSRDSQTAQDRDEVSQLTGNSHRSLTLTVSLTVQPPSPLS